MKRMRAVDANRVFLISVVFSQAMIFLVTGAGVRDRMVLQILMQMFLAAPAVAYLFMQRVSIKEGLAVHAIGWVEWLLLLPLAICINHIAGVINVLSQLFTVNTISNSMAELVMKYPFPFAFFTIAVVPAFCEESLFRGVLYRGYRKCGTWVAILLTAFLFGVMHMNPNQFFYAFALGIVFALVNEITGSCLPSFFLHMYINGSSVMNLFLTVRDNEEALQESITIDAAAISEYLTESLPWTVAAVAGMFVVLFLLIRCKGSERKRMTPLFGKEEIEPKEERGGFGVVCSPALLTGVIICVWYMILRTGS